MITKIARLIRPTKLPDAAKVFWVFLRLGLTSFGGPIAHLGYFRTEFVLQRKWMDEKSFADFVGLCQFLPGPASSQVGFGIGLLRAGYLGALAAWLGFTMPSALAMVVFAYSAASLNTPLGLGVLHGLKLTAVAVVAQAVWGMARSLCPDLQRAAIAVLCGVLMLWASSSVAQIAAIGLGAVAGLLLCRTHLQASFDNANIAVSKTVGTVALILCAVLLVGLPLLQKATGSESLLLFNAFYRSGALVFGGGHVVLPLLQDAFVAPGWIGDDTFLAGYGAAQAMPGPLFTFAAYLGALVKIQPHGIAGSLLDLVGIFLPGLLVLLGILPFWQTLRQQATAQAAMRGVNAAVVGILAAALYNPVLTQTITGFVDVVIASLSVALLTIWRVHPIIIVVFNAMIGAALVLAGYSGG